MLFFKKKHISTPLFPEIKVALRSQDSRVLVILKVFGAIRKAGHITEARSFLTDAIKYQSTQNAIDFAKRYVTIK